MASKPEMASKPKVTLSLDDLKDFLECPICMTIPNEGPIYQCESGHIICKDCHPKLEQCPQCRQKLGKIRALQLEKIIEKYNLHMTPTSSSDDKGQVKTSKIVLSADSRISTKTQKVKKTSTISMHCHCPVINGTANHWWYCLQTITPEQVALSGHFEISTSDPEWPSTLSTARTSTHCHCPFVRGFVNHWFYCRQTNTTEQVVLSGDSEISTSSDPEGPSTLSTARKVKKTSTHCHCPFVRGFVNHWFYCRQTNNPEQVVHSGDSEISTSDPQPRPSRQTTPEEEVDLFGDSETNDSQMQLPKPSKTKISTVVKRFMFRF